MKSYSLAMLAALACAALVSLPTRGLADQRDTLNSTDSQFIKDAAADGMAEVKLAELGVQKTTRSDVKELAQTMIKDHSAANSDLENVAKTKGIDVSGVIAPKYSGQFQDLEKSSGGDFDTAFLKQMQKNHKDAVALFEKEQKDVKDGMLKTFVDKTLPTIKSHLDMINSLLGK